MSAIVDDLSKNDLISYLFGRAFIEKIKPFFRLIFLMIKIRKNGIEKLPFVCVVLDSLSLPLTMKLSVTLHFMIFCPFDLISLLFLIEETPKQRKPPWVSYLFWRTAPRGRQREWAKQEEGRRAWNTCFTNKILQEKRPFGKAGVGEKSITISE